MLAPLKDRSILERETGQDETIELQALRISLRQARRLHKRSATLAARKIVELTNELNRLSETNRQLKARLDELESGQAMTAMAQQLLALRQENDELAATTQRLWFLDRTLCAAHRECERLARERDAALGCLQHQVEHRPH